MGLCYMNIEKRKKILVVAPHPDDESIGCGGLLSLYGKQCDVLIVTDGRHGHLRDDNVNEEELIEIRKIEVKNAINMASVNELFFLDIEDRTVYKNHSIVSAVNICSYDYVFVPNRYEGHRDHREMVNIFKKAKRKQRAKAELIEYEIGTPMLFAPLLLDITDVIEEKKRMIEAHRSQIKDVDFVDQGLSINRYRAIYGNCGKYAEAFCPVSYNTFLRRFWYCAPERIRRIIKKGKD